MKTVEWEICPALVLPQGKEKEIEPGMEVIGGFKDFAVILEIAEKIKEETQSSPAEFRAVVKGLETLGGLPRPEDIKKGDEVLIDRPHICWVLKGP